MCYYMKWISNTCNPKRNLDPKAFSILFFIFYFFLLFLRVHLKCLYFLKDGGLRWISRSEGCKMEVSRKHWLKFWDAPIDFSFPFLSFIFTFCFPHHLLSFCSPVSSWILRINPNFFFLTSLSTSFLTSFFTILLHVHHEHLRSQNDTFCESLWKKLTSLWIKFIPPSH